MKPESGLARLLSAKLFMEVSLLVLLSGLAQAGYAQQSGAGLRIMEPETDSICRGETVHDCAAFLSKKQAETMLEMTEVLKRTAEIQRKLSEGPSPAEKKEIRAELAGLMERTDRMMSELQSLMRGKR